VEFKLRNKGPKDACYIQQSSRRLADSQFTPPDAEATQLDGLFCPLVSLFEFEV